jgi:hypothetical protein
MRRSVGTGVMQQTVRRTQSVSMQQQSSLLKGAAAAGEVWDGEVLRGEILEELMQVETRSPAL